MSVPPAAAPTVPPLLLAEALGFSPQLLLDDIVSIANNSIVDGVDGMENFLNNWGDARIANKQDSEDTINQEIEHGLISFQTLLEYHTDLAFDFFELWALRNIFAVPPDLPIVLPHHDGLDLSATPEREQELMDEADELRAKIKEQRALKRELTKANRVAEARKAIINKRLERLHMLDTPAIENYASAPQNLLALYASVSSLPASDPEMPTTLAQLQLTDPGKQKWETSKVGYLNWAVEQLLARREHDEENTTADLGEMARRESEIGTTEQLKQMLKAFELADGMRKSLGGNPSRMDTS